MTHRAAERIVKMKVYKLYRQAASGAWEPLFGAVEAAENPWRRLRGLLGRKGLGNSDGLLLSPCAGVHTLGMRFALDLVFIDKTGSVLQCVADLRPNRMAAKRGARHTLELAAGTLAQCGLTSGDRLKWERA